MCSQGKIFVFYFMVSVFFVVTNGGKKQSDIHYSWSGDHIIFIIISLTTVTDGCYRNRSVSKYLQQHLLGCFA